jgi:thiol-disulfide isomerase/thioredoxin
MKLKLFIPLAFSLVFFIHPILYAQDSTQESPLEFFGQQNIGKKFSKINYKSVTGESFTAKKIKHKICFINFWFEGCEPCIAEFPALNELYNKFKNSKDFILVTFTFETPARAQQVISKYNLSFPVICVSSIVCDTLNFRSGYPTSILLNRKRIVKFFFTGGVRDPEIAKDNFHKLIEPKILWLLSE